MTSAGQKSCEATKQCRMCGEDIKQIARKCVYCDGWQNSLWGLTSLATITLPMIVAILSLLITAIPVIQSAMTPKKSILSGAFQGIEGIYLSALVSNQGGRPGTVGGAYMMIVDTRKKIVWGAFLDVTTDDHSGAIVVEHDKSALVSFHVLHLYEFIGAQVRTFNVPIDANVPIQLSQINFSNVGRDNCTLKYVYTNFDSSPYSTVQDIDCATAAIFLGRTPVAQTKTP